jgi:alkanesulfonate monooxygenase SsuD/methylene tetrahydromethanopterin reductase-like flavin-dependent oxidoreductase (luciferase family)
VTQTAPIPVGVALGTIGLEGDAWLRAAALLAAAPIDRLWIWDHLMGRGAPERPVLEGTTLAAAALAQNPNLRVGTLVLDVTKRHPALTAKIAATLDAIAPGRFTLGIGAGGDAAEHDALGMPYGEVGERIAALSEQVAVARAMLSGDPSERMTLTTPGSLNGAASAPRPGARLRLLIAGDHPSSIGLAASFADEWVAPAASFAAGLTQLRERERAAGRAKPLVRTHLLHQLSASERLIDSPFGRDPQGVLAEAHAAGADGLIVTVRTERDAEEALQLLAKLR